MQFGTKHNRNGQRKHKMCIQVMYMYIYYLWGGAYGGGGEGSVNELCMVLYTIGLEIAL